MINFYALDYMYADAHYDQFMALLSLFGLAINCLALTNNLGALYFTCRRLFDLVKTIDLDIVNLLTPWFRY